MKKIVLATLPSEGEFRNWTTPSYFQTDLINRHIPIGILSLATNLPKGYDVVIFDPVSNGWSIDETISKIEDENPDVLGLSVVTRRTYAMKLILEKTSASYKVVGGPHATYYADQILEFGADAVFIGGIADTEFKKAMKTMPKGTIHCKTNINDIKYPDRTLLDINRYFPESSRLFKANKRLSMFSTIGCPNRCTFCNVQSKKVQFKNPKTVVDEMEYLYSLGCRSAHIIDDNFNINRRHVEGILDEMEKRNFSMEWSARGQVRMDLKLVKRMAKFGLKRMHIGIEALDNKILKFFNKNLKVEDIHKFCKEMNKHDVDILGYFIIGSPVETREYRSNLSEKIKRLKIKYPFFNVLFPEPDTEYYYQLVRQGIYDRDYWKEYMKNPIPDYEIPYPYGESKKKEIWQFIDKLIREHYN